MNRPTSVYLDLVRFLASMAVFLGHASYARFNGEWLQGIGFLKHDAVIVFFVLSGYVIAYVSTCKETDLLDYAVSRLARLYSVVLPALLLTLLLDNWGAVLDPQRYSGYAFDYPLIRFLATILFANQLHFISISAFSNGPFWSVAFEFWYYVIFGIAFYLKDAKRALLLTVVFFVAGLKILLLWPIWLVGMLIFRVRLKPVGQKTGWFFFLGSFLLYFIFHCFGINKLLDSFVANMLGEQLMDKLLWSGSFLSDYILSMIIALNFVGLVAVSESLAGLLVNSAERFIRFFAGYTFSIYLLHFPLLNFFASFMSSNLLVIASTLSCIFFVGTFTEKKKHVFKRWISCLSGRLVLNPNASA